MARRRAELVDAGVRLALGQPFQAWLSSVDTRTITDAVGVTTGSFFHHFRNRAEFAQAVSDRFVELWGERVAHITTHSLAVAEEEDTDVQRAADREWAALQREPTTVALQHLLWVARDQAIGDDASTTAGDVLREAYAELTRGVVPVYEMGNATLRREMMPPFSSLDLLVLMIAVAEGLLMRATVDPGSVRPDLYADGVSALYIALTRPIPERAESVAGVDLSTLTSSLTAPRPVDEEAAAQPETWKLIAEAAAPLFVDRSPVEVRLSEVAEAAGVSPSTVSHHFGSVNAVAAAGFGRHVPELVAISTRPLTAAEGPMRRIEQVLTRYVELLREHRGVAEALMSEVARGSGPAERDRGGRGARRAGPVTDLLLDHVREMRARGELRRRIETDRLARALVQLCTVNAMLYEEDSVERIVDGVLTLVFDGALAVGTSG